MARGAIYVDISLLGDKKLARTFARLPGSVQKKLTRKALRDGAKIILRRARIYASGISKLLGRKLKVRALKRKDRSIFGAVVLTPTKAELGIPEDAKGYWPAHVELGFVHVGGEVIPPESYLRRATDECEQEVFRFIDRELWRYVEEEWRRG